MRSIALDVHRDFCEVAIKDGGERCARPGASRPAPTELELFAQSLAPDDQVALEATGPALQIARVLEPHVGRVVIANTRKLRAIAEAKVKTDKLDARTLCELLAAGFLPEVFGPDEETRALRRRLARRAALVRQRTRAKNELHAVLARNLKGKPPMSDVFGVRGRAWLEALALPADERETVAGCLRQVDFLDREVAERGARAGAIRARLRGDPPADERAGGKPRLGGDLLGHGRRHRRFETPRKLVSYVGLDPRVRQSGEAPARHGHISKQGSPAARHMLCEAAWIVVRTPGPLRAFYRAPAGPARGADRARRDGAQALRAVLAPADQGGGLRLRAAVAHPPQAAPARAARRRSLASRAAARARGVKARAGHERELSEQFELAYRRLVDDWQPKRSGAGATRGRAS